MTLGRSRLVEDFLKQASATRAFEVIVAEGGPFLNVCIRICRDEFYSPVYIT